MALFGKTLDIVFGMDKWVKCSFIDALFDELLPHHIEQPQSTFDAPELLFREAQKVAESASVLDTLENFTFSRVI